MLDVFAVLLNSNHKKYLSKIGKALKAKDGSYIVKIDCLPLNGVLYIKDSHKRQGKDWSKIIPLKPKPEHLN